MLLRRLRDDAPFTPMNGVRPLPPVQDDIIRPLPPVDDSFYQVRPLPPVDGSVRLAYGDAGGGVFQAGGAMSGAMPDFSTEGGFTPPPITFPNTMDEYADRSRSQAQAPRMLEEGMDEYAKQSQSPLQQQTAALVDQLGQGETLDYTRAYNQYEHGDQAKGMRGLGMRARQAVAAPVTRVSTLAKMLYDNTTNPYYDSEKKQYRGLPIPKLAVNDIEKMNSRDYVEEYRPRRRG